MICKKCIKDLIYENKEYELYFCESCDKIEIKSKDLWHIKSIKLSEIEELIRLNYTMNYIIFEELSKLYQVNANQNFIDLVNFIEEYLEDGNS